MGTAESCTDHGWKDRHAACVQARGNRRLGLDSSSGSGRGEGERERGTRLGRGEWRPGPAGQEEIDERRARRKMATRRVVEVVVLVW